MEKNERLKEQIIDTQEYIAILDKKLLNEAFVNKAPEKLVRAACESGAFISIIMIQFHTSSR